MLHGGLDMNRVAFILSMLIFSTVGITVFALSVSPAVTAFFRAFCGTLTLLAVLFVSGRKINRAALKKNAFLLVLSGAALALSWILIFAAYSLTGVAVSTVCYYTSPALVILFSALFLREKTSVFKIFCAFLALAGMIPVSGVLSSNTAMNIKGVLISFTAALLYAFVVISNKKIRNLSGIETSVVQLAVASAVTGLYVFFTEPVSSYPLIIPDLKLLLLLGVLHTGVAYLLYFSSVRNLSAADCAVFSCIATASALIISYVFLSEKLTKSSLVGIVMIFGAAILVQLFPKRKKKQK